MVKHFLLSIASLKPDWSMKEVIDMQIKAITDLVRGGAGLATPLCPISDALLPQPCTWIELLQIVNQHARG